MGLEVCFIKAHCLSYSSLLLCHHLCFTLEVLSKISAGLPFVNPLESIQSASGARHLPVLILCGIVSKLTDGAVSSICFVDSSWEDSAWMEYFSPLRSQQKAASIYLLLWAYKIHRGRLRVSLNDTPWKYRKSTINGNPRECSSHTAIWRTCLSSNNLRVSTVSTTSISSWGEKKRLLWCIYRLGYSPLLFFQRCISHKWWIQHKEYQLYKETCFQKDPCRQNPAYNKPNTKNTLCRNFVTL